MSGLSTTPPSGMGPNSGLPPPPYPGFSPSHAAQSPMISSHGPSSVGSNHGLPSSPGFFPPKPSPTGMILTPFQQQQQQMLPQQQQHNSGAIYSDYEEKERLRFQIELEFVQCLANPNYLNFLAQRGYFKEKCFVNYLKYLHGYWTQPAYVKFLKYPLCLHFLELLQHEDFRKEIVNAQCAKFLDDQSILQWQQYTRKRMRLMENPSSAGNILQMPAATNDISIKQEK